MKLKPQQPPTDQIASSLNSSWMMGRLFACIFQLPGGLCRRILCLVFGRGFSTRFGVEAIPVALAALAPKNPKQCHLVFLGPSQSRWAKQTLRLF